MLHSVRLENFGPHELFEQEFGPGITLVLGPNGIGKSNILYGVSWIGFGTKGLPAEYKQSDIIRDGAEFVSGEMVMDLLAVPHTFSRTYDGKNVQAAVFRGDEQVASGARGVEEFLAMYGITWQAASVLFSRQRELDAFVYETPAKRKEIFESLLRVEVVNEARKIAKARQKQNTAPFPVILTENEPGELEAEVLMLETAITDATAVVTKLTLDVEAAGVRRDSAFEAITAASTDDEARTFQGNMRRAQDKVYKLNKELDAINPTIMAAPSMTPEQVEKVKVTIAKREAEIVKGQKDMEFALEAAQMFSDEKGRVIGHIEAVESTMRKLEDGRCPTCGTEIEDAASHVAEVHDMSLEDLRAKKDSIYDGACSAQKGIALIQGALEAAEQERIELSSELGMFEYAVSLVPEAERLNSEIGLKEHEVTGWEEKIRSLSGPSQEQRDEFTDADVNRAAVELRHLNAQEDLKRLHTVIGERKQLVDLYTEAADAAAKSEESRKLWAAVAKAMDEFRNQVLQSALNWVSLRATQIVRMIGTLPETGPDVTLSIDEKLQFWFSSGDKDYPVYRFSGGQKAVFAICLRMALSEYFSDRLGLKGFLLLDAVLDSLTEENQAATAAALLASGPQQAVIFSHFDVDGLEATRVRL